MYIVHSSLSFRIFIISDSYFYFFQQFFLFTGISKTSSVFTGLEFTGFSGDTVSSEVRSNPSVLYQFLSEYGFEINICIDNMVLGETVLSSPNS